MYSFLGGVASSSDGLFDHPTEDITIAGEAIQPLPSTFHGLLQTVSDLMLLLPVGSSLQVCYYIIVFFRIVDIVFMFFIYFFLFFTANCHNMLVYKIPSSRSQLFTPKSRFLYNQQDLVQVSKS